MMNVKNVSQKGVGESIMDPAADELKHVTPGLYFPVTHLTQAVVRGIELAFQCQPDEPPLAEWLKDNRADYTDCESLNDICEAALCSPYLDVHDREPVLIAYRAIQAMLWLDNAACLERARVAIERHQATQLQID